MLVLEVSTCVCMCEDKREAVECICMYVCAMADTDFVFLFSMIQSTL